MTDDRRSDSSVSMGTILAVALVVAVIAGGLLALAIAIGRNDDEGASPATTTDAPATTTTGAPSTTTVPPATTDAPATTTTGAPTTTTVPPATSGPVGEKLALDDGSLARVNAVGPGRSSPGTTEAEVERCAGSTPIEVNPLVWAAVEPDGSIGETPITDHDLVTLTLAPGGCARGWVDLGVDADDPTPDVVLLDAAFTEVGRWRPDGATTPEAPLTPPVEPEPAAPGDVVELENGTTATVFAANRLGLQDDGRSLVEVELEQCAGTVTLDVDPLLWLTVSEDHHLVAGELDQGTFGPATLAAGECVDGTVLMRTLASSLTTDVVLLDADFVEVARFSVG